MLKTFILILLLLSCYSKNKAILLSSSLGFYNYRQSSNILKIYAHLKERGLNDDDIILMIPENGKCSLKNSKLGSINFYDGDYTDIGKNVELDYSHSDMKLKNVYDVFTFKYHPYTINAKRLQTDSDTNILIYVTGHGGDDYFKLLQREALLKQHVKTITDYLWKNNMYSKLFLVSDSCSASTIFEDITAPNIITLGSSSRQQKSLSFGYDIQLNAPKSDGFTYYTDKFLNEKKSDSTIKQLYQYLDYSKLQVNSKLTSTFKKGTLGKLKLSQFLNQPDNKIIKVEQSDFKQMQNLARSLLNKNKQQLKI